AAIIDIREIAGHAEVQMQPRVLRRRVDEEMFAVALRARELAPFQLARERILADLAEDAFVAHVDAGDALMQRVLREIARVTFDFGKLRHAVREYASRTASGDGPPSAIATIARLPRSSHHRLVDCDREQIDLLRRARYGRDGRAFRRNFSTDAEP